MRQDIPKTQKLKNLRNYLESKARAGESFVEINVEDEAQIILNLPKIRGYAELVSLNNQRAVYEIKEYGGKR